MNANNETLTHIDEATKIELQPPCNYELGIGKTITFQCKAPADWILRLTYECGGKTRRVIRLFCTGHKGEALRFNDWNHSNCGRKHPITIVGLEPLR